MRRLRALLVILVLALVAAPAAAADEMTVFHRTISFELDFVDTSCGFPVHIVGTEDHRQSFHYRDLPDGVAPVSQRALAYQVFGAHMTRSDLTLINDANGREIDLHGVSNLKVRDFDASNLTFDALGRRQGSITAINEDSFSFTATAPGVQALKIAGHEVAQRTDTYVNGVRVGSTGETLAFHGVVRDELCAYLAG